MLNIDKLSGTPIYEQIIEQIQHMIASGSLSPGDQIPSVRSLSLELSINPNTIQKAYNELEKQGITVSVPGVGRYVSTQAKKLLQEKSGEKLEDLRKTIYDLAVAGVSEQDVITAVQSEYQRVNTDKGKRDKID